jgi:uncharacterized damage-inducible protein DinB
MSTVAALRAQFDEEMASTRKILERVPEDKFAWKPHKKSSTLGKLASHVAGLPAYTAVFIQGRGWKPPDAASKAQLLELFDKNAAACREALAGASEEQLNKDIPGQPDRTKPLRAVLQGRIMNHLIHHRGQLSVYLRLLDVAVPGMYGPSADEK